MNATLRWDSNASHEQFPTQEQRRKLIGGALEFAHLFPPGSTQKPTDAKNTIWKNWSDFERKAAALEAESRKLMNASPDEPAVLGAQFRAVSETCGGCHEKYRVRRRKGDL